MPAVPEPALCPKCSRPRVPGAAECPSCGIIFARWQPGPRRPAPPKPAANVLPTTVLENERVYLSPSKVETLLVVVSQALDAGLPLPSIASGPAVSALPPAIARRLQADANDGIPLSRTLAALKILDAGSLALVMAGERHGRLPESLRQVATRLEDRRKARNKLLLALIYPTFLFLGAVLILPLPTLFSKGIGAYADRTLPILMAFAAVLVFALVVFPRLPPDSPLRLFVRRLGATLPLSSMVLWRGALASFTEVLGASLRAGLPVRESIEMAVRSASHPRLDEALPAIVARIEAGATLADALCSVRGLDPSLLSQIGAGEQSGTLDQILPKIAEEERRKSRIATLVLVAAIGGIVLAIVTVVVAYEVIQGWRGILDSRVRSFEDIASGQ